MSDDVRPDPDTLLAALRQNEKAARQGKLSIFFGLAAGAGKTYAMLEAAQQRLKEGIDVVIGIVETHGRAETESLVIGLPIIPQKKIAYRDVVLEELDLDAILARRPNLILVDELAHTNAPGSRHTKRWHDVVELLDAGINVYTTLNVQHIESRKSDVESITGITIRETVPDSIFERAAQIELIDITPNELLERLHAGKVYLGGMADRAAENFFKEDHLAALREIALRLTAEKVENDLQTLLALKGRVAGWRSTERIMVAISHSPTSENLIRTTRRIAFSLDAPWIAVYVDSGIALRDDDKAQLSRNLTLVRELGGEIVSTAGPDVAEVLTRIAQQHGITQIVFGRPARRWFRNLFSGGTLLEKLVSKSGDFDVLILRHDKPIQKPKGWRWPILFSSGLLSYWYLLWIVTAVALINGLLNPIIGYKAVGFIFLLSILIISLFVSLGPILFAAILSALTWDFFFIPPRGTFYIRDPEDIIMAFTYLLVAVVTGTLTHRIRSWEKMFQRREERTQALYEIVKIIAMERGKEKFISEVANRLGLILNAQCSVLLSDSSSGLKVVDSLRSAFWLNEQEMAIAKYSFNNNQTAGWSTDTLPSTKSMFLPLRGTLDTVGVLVFKPESKTKLVPEEANFLNTVARQLAIGVERVLSNEKSQEAQRLQESERLHQTILNSISHEMRTPLTTIIGAASALQNDDISENKDMRKELAEEMIAAADRLNLVVENLLDTSRLSSGVYQLKREWCDLQDIVSIALESPGRTLKQYQIRINLPEQMPLIFVDFRLFEQAISNLLRNAVAMAPPDTLISIEATTKADTLIIIISDSGPGIKPESLARIFERFYRVPGTPAGGVGLGLWLVKSIVELHGGKISVTNRPERGACFSIQLPIEHQPDVPKEAENAGGE